MSDSSTMRSALAVNAGFSAASGIVLASAPGPIGGVIGVDVDPLLRVFGVVLMIHAALLLAALRGTALRRWAQLNLAAIAPYPFAMGIVAITVADGGEGAALVLADGAATALIAVAIATGLRRERTVTAPA